MTDPLQRWRLVLGNPAEQVVSLSGDAAAADAALDWLYGRDLAAQRRGIRRGGADRAGGLGDSTLSTFEWLDEIHRLFPKETIERLEQDAIERFDLTDVITSPEVLERVEPNATLLRAVMRTKHLMNPDVLAMARRIVAAVVRELMDQLATEVRSVFSGTRARTSSRFKVARNFDAERTIRANLGHYRPDEKRLYVETPYFRSRTRRQLDRWQVILLVDQSGSMVDSVIHSAVTAACLWGLPGVKTHLVAFDTNVVDLTSEVEDPVDLLMKVQLGGGTDIARAVQYGAQLVENPRRTIFVVISDFFEGGSTGSLIRTIASLCEQGTHVLGLAALDGSANASYDRVLGQRLANVGAHMGAMTPGELAAFIAEKVGS